ncbi:MAG TPA: VWA domain-containing protein [Thermoanaerobaculia bacterium]
MIAPVEARLDAQFSDAIDVSIANVDVVVLDRTGKLVRGLTPEDFEILEEGKRQEITHFAAYSSEPDVVLPGTLSIDASAPTRPPAKPRLLAVFIDVSDIDPNERQRFFTALRTFVRDQWRPGDYGTILLWTSRVREIVPLTHDFNAVDVVLAALEFPRLVSDWSVIEEMAEQRLLEVARNPEVYDLDQERAYDERIRMEQQCSISTRKFRSLRGLVASLAAHDLQKTLILASDSMSLRPAPTCLLRDEMEEVATTANAHGVTIHAIHPPGTRVRYASAMKRGLPATRDPAPGAGEGGRTVSEIEGLSLVAARTGGTLASGPHDVERMLPQIADHLDNYYSLAYRMQPGTTDEPRPIRVRTKNRAYKVFARQSVVLLSDDSRIRDAVIANAYAPAGASGRVPVGLKITSAIRDGRNVRIGVEVSAPMSAVTGLPGADGTERGAFTIWATSGRAPGDAAEVSRQEVPFAFPAGATASEEAIQYRFEMVLRRGTPRVSIGFRDETSKDFGLATIEVPSI